MYNPHDSLRDLINTILLNDNFAVSLDRVDHGANVTTVCTATRNYGAVNIAALATRENDPELDNRYTLHLHHVSGAHYGWWSINLDAVDVGELCDDHTGREYYEMRIDDICDGRDSHDIDSDNDELNKRDSVARIAALREFRDAWGEDPLAFAAFDALKKL